MKTSLKTTFQKAFVASLPVMAGYVVLAIGFGFLLNAIGYGVGWSVIMSVFIYAGSMQYLAVDLLSGGATLIAAAVAQRPEQRPQDPLRGLCPSPSGTRGGDVRPG